MSYAAAALSGATVLVLLWALIVGEPVSITDTNARLIAQSTEVADLRATIAARPTPTVVCFVSSHRC